MRRVLIALVMLALFASACSGGSDDSAAAGTPAVPAPTEVPSTTAAGDTDDGADSQDDEVDPADADASAASVSTRAPFCEVGEIGADRSLNLAGSLMFAQHNLNGDGWPTYRLDADIDPVSGMVNARMRAVVPDRSEQLNFRVFPGVASFEADLSISEVTVDGVAATSSLTEALLTIDNPTPNGTANPVIELEFAYVLQETAASSNLLEGLTGESLEPAKVGLLGRTPGGAQLGHWFPIWLPPVSRLTPVLMALATSVPFRRPGSASRCAHPAATN